MRGTTTDYYQVDNGAAFGFPDFNDEPLNTSGPATVLPSGSLNDWGSWARNIGGMVIGGAVDSYKYRTIAGAGGIPEVGQNGNLYTVGTRSPIKQPAPTIGGLSISPMILIAGAGLVALLLVMRK